MSLPATEIEFLSRSSFETLKICRLGCAKKLIGFKFASPLITLFPQLWLKSPGKPNFWRTRTKWQHKESFLKRNIFRRKWKSSSFSFEWRIITLRFFLYQGGVRGRTENFPFRCGSRKPPRPPMTRFIEEMTAAKEEKEIWDGLRADDYNWAPCSQCSSLLFIMMDRECTR